MSFMIRLLLVAALTNLSVLSFAVGAERVSAAEFHQLVQQQNVSTITELLTPLSQQDRSQVLESTFENGDTALLFAAREQNLDLYDLLIDFGANPNAMDVNSRDVLNIAILLRNIELAKRAIAAGNDVTLVTSRFEGSALIYASHQAQVEIVQMLIAAGAPLDRINNVGWTAMLEAVVLGDGSKAYQDIVSALVAAGADRDIADKQGVTPLSHAKQRGHDAMVRILSAP